MKMELKAKGTWVADDDDVIMLVDMQVVYGAEFATRQSLVPWTEAVRKATYDKYGHSPSVELLRDMWQHIVDEIYHGRITVQRRVVYTTPQCG
tara:strand:+ start:6745 stop:7023 length:279 start_codon:yes stop_codon:yes gene_type:complete